MSLKKTLFLGLALYLFVWPLQAQDCVLSVYDLTKPQNAALDKLYGFITDTLSGNAPQNLFKNNGAEQPLSTERLKNLAHFKQFIPYLALVKQKKGDKWEVCHVYTYFWEQVASIDEQGEYRYTDAEYIGSYSPKEVFAKSQKSLYMVWENNKMSLGEALRLDTQTQEDMAGFLIENAQLGRIKLYQDMALSTPVESINHLIPKHPNYYLLKLNEEKTGKYYTPVSMTLYINGDKFNKLIGHVSYSDFAALANNVFVCSPTQKVFENAEQVLNGQSYSSVQEVELPNSGYMATEVSLSGSPFRNVSNDFRWELNLELAQNSHLYAKGKLVKKLLNAAKKQQLKAKIGEKEISYAEMQARMSRKPQTAITEDNGQEIKPKKITKKDLFTAKDLSILNIQGQMVYDKQGQKKHYQFQTITVCLPAAKSPNPYGFDYVIAKFDYQDCLRALAKTQFKTVKGRKNFEAICQELLFLEDRWYNGILKYAPTPRD